MKVLYTRCGWIWFNFSNWQDNNLLSRIFQNDWCVIQKYFCAQHFLLTVRISGLVWVTSSIDIPLIIPVFATSCPCLTLYNTIGWGRICIPHSNDQYVVVWLGCLVVKIILISFQISVRSLHHFFSFLILVK